jgi:archaeal preflagellin peptidase FlaK
MSGALRRAGSGQRVNVESTAIEAAEVVALLGGFTYAAMTDVRTREVSDRLWQFLGAVGLVLGLLAVGPGGPLPVVLWLLVAGLTLQHVFPWDEHLGARGEGFADALELAAYIGVIVVVGLAVARYGVGATGVPIGVIAVLATVVLARGLFELGALFGGADAKALMIAGLLVPVFPNPLLSPLSAAHGLLAFLPFPIDLLTNAAVFSLVVPLAIGLRNVRRGDLSFPRGFTGFMLPVSELPRRFVWIDDPVWSEGRHTDDARTTAEDEHRRRDAAQRLTERGVTRVWVTPQLPFLLLMAVGAFTAIAVGNVLLDLLLVL